MREKFNVHTFRRTVEKLLDDARATVRFADGGAGEDHGANERELADLLEKLYEAGATALELLGASDAVTRFHSDYTPWRDRRRQLIVRDPQTGAAASPALDCIEHRVAMIYDFCGLAPGGDTLLIPSAELLRNILRNTPCVLRDRRIVPKCEADIARAMRQTLAYTFKDTSGEFTLHGIIKGARPDAAIRSLKTLIEFKFVPEERVLRRCLDELSADVHVFTPSMEWSRFIAVIYQTEPFTTQERVEEDCRERGFPESWEVIVVTGVGGNGSTP